MTLVFLTGTVSFLVVFAILGQDNRDHLTAESSMDFTVRLLQNECMSREKAHILDLVSCGGVS